jgi:hypothetical protein
VPSGDVGVGSATNGTFLQVGGALGVAVLGSLLTTRYTGDVTATVLPSMSQFHAPASAVAAVRGSLGGAMDLAQRVEALPGMAALGRNLATLARQAFVSGMDLGLRAGAVVAVCGCVIALAALPGRSVRRQR